MMLRMEDLPLPDLPISKTLRLREAAAADAALDAMIQRLASALMMGHLMSSKGSTTLFHPPGPVNEDFDNVSKKLSASMTTPFWLSGTCIIGLNGTDGSTRWQ
jgi:hypothetical protein